MIITTARIKMSSVVPMPIFLLSYGLFANIHRESVHPNPLAGKHREEAGSPTKASEQHAGGHHCYTKKTEKLAPIGMP
jgi:hypothetical protein